MQNESLMTPQTYSEIERYKIECEYKERRVKIIRNGVCFIAGCVLVNEVMKRGCGEDTIIAITNFFSACVGPLAA